MGIDFFSGRVMVFVDGTNFLCHLSLELKIQFKAEKPPLEAIRIATEMIKHRYEIYWTDIVKVRNYWFASYKGNREDYRRLAKELRKCDFEPVLFQKKGEREKGVDIELAKQMLVNAFHKNFDIGILIAGDEDYLELINEVKRYGPRIYGAFFRRHGLSKELELAFDQFHAFDEDEQKLFKSSPYEKLIEELKRKCDKSTFKENTK